MELLDLCGTVTFNDFKLRCLWYFMTRFCTNIIVSIQTVDGDKSNTFNFSIGTS